jgi:outer membrane protein TolC
MRRRFCLAFLLWSFGLVAHAQDTPVTLEQAVARALKNNSSLAVLAFEPALAEADLLREQGAFDPILLSSVQQQSIAGAGGTDYSLGMSQRLGFGGSYGVAYTLGPDIQGRSSSRTSLNVRLPLLRGAGAEVAQAGVRIATSELQASRLQLRAAALDLVAEVEAAYWSLVLARRLAVVRQQALEQARVFLDMLKQEIEAGSAAPYELFEAEQNVASREADVQAALGDVEIGRQALLRLLGWQGQPLEVLLDIPEAEIPSLAECEELALSCQPELKAAEVEVAIRDVRLRVAENATLPQLDFIASHNLASTGVNAYSWQAGLQLSIPIGNRAAQGQQQRAQAARGQALAVVEDLRQDVLLRTAQAHAALAASREQRLASERATAAARQRVEAESERFSSGFASAHTVVLAQQQQLATEENLLAALIKQQLSLVTLRRAVGSALQDWPNEGGGP